jgi:hypothetical protein
MVGRLLVGVVKDVIPPEYGSGKIRIYRADDPKYRVRGDLADDNKLALAIKEDLEGADAIIGHNSKLFDRKFLNARLIKGGHDPLKSQWHIDTMWIVRTHLRISSKLANVQAFLGLPDEKTEITWDDWMRGQGMDSRAISEIETHCIQDVKVLEQAYWKLLPYMREIRRA